MLICAIEDAQPLSALAYLEILIADHNQIADLRFLYHSDALQELNLGDNRIKSLYPLVHLPNLTSINLENNEITSLRGIQDMEELSYLKVRGNDLQGDLSVWYDTLFFIEQLILTEDDYRYQTDEDYEASLYEYKARGIK